MPRMKPGSSWSSGSVVATSTRWAVPGRPPRGLAGWTPRGMASASLASGSFTTCASLRIHAAVFELAALLTRSATAFGPVVSSGPGPVP